VEALVILAILLNLGSLVLVYYVVTRFTMLYAWTNLVVALFALLVSLMVPGLPIGEERFCVFGLRNFTDVLNTSNLTHVVNISVPVNISCISEPRLIDVRAPLSYLSFFNVVVAAVLLALAAIFGSYRRLARLFGE